MMHEADIRVWLTGHIAEFLDIPKDEVKPDAAFTDLGLDSVCTCVIKSVSQDFECNPADLVLGGRRQSSPLALLNQVENGGILVCLSGGRQFLTRGSEQFGEITLGNWLRTQTLNGIPALGERFLGFVDRLVQRLLGFSRVSGHQVAGRLKLEHQSVKRLQQSIVQISRDAGALIHLRFQPYLELMLYLPQAVLIEQPQQ